MQVVCKRVPLAKDGSAMAESGVVDYMTQVYIECKRSKNLGIPQVGCGCVCDDVILVTREIIASSMKRKSTHFTYRQAI